MQKDYIEELQKIYDSEINFTIETFWDGGITIKIGDEQNGFEYENTYSTFEEAIKNLISKVMKLYPDSEYFKNKLKRT